MSEEATLNDFAEGQREGGSKEFEAVPESPVESSLDETSVGMIPEDWIATRLGDIAEETEYGLAESAEEYDPDKPRYIRTQDFDDFGGLKENSRASLSREKAKDGMLKKGDMLFARSGSVGASLGKTYLYDSDDGDCCFGGYSIRHQLQDAGLNHKYISEYTLSDQYWDWVRRRAKTTAQSNINTGEYGSLLLPIPPLPEQRKIATVLYTVDRAIEKTEELVEQLSRVRKGVFQSVFKRGVTDSDTKQTRVLSIDTEIPEHWEITSVGDISILVTDGAHLTPEKSDSGYYLLGARNVQNGYIDLESADYVSSEEYERLIEKCHPEPNDILMSCRGVGLGRIGLMPEGLECALLCSAALIKLSESVHPEYIEKALRHIDTQKQIKALQTQSAQPNLFQNEIARLEFPLPPIEEQEKIANILSRYDEQIQHEQEYKEQLNRLKHGLLQDLLSGTVRTTDTNIEVPEKITQHG